MDAQATAVFLRFFLDLKDPRRHNVRHVFTDLLTIAILAVLCKSDDWIEVVEWAKANEITALPALLDLLQLKGAIVTIDAMGCQRDIARQIVDKRGDYLLAVKENQPTLHQKIKTLLDQAIIDGFAGGMGHDRFEQ